MMIPADARKALMVDGASVVKAFLSRAQLEAIDAELAPWLSQIAWNNNPGYSLRGADKWLDHVGLCSPTLIRIVLDETLLDFMKSVFGEEPILGECSVHDSVTPNGELAFHSDRDGGVLMYLMLTGMNESNGLLSYIPGTQDDDRYFYIPADEIARRADSIVPFRVDRGDAVLFDEDVWHRRAPGGPGRRVVKVLYHAVSGRHGAVDHLYRQNFLAGLSERQLRAFGIGHPPFERTSHLGKVGRPFRRADLQTIALYLRRFRRVDLRRTPPNPEYGAEKLRPRPPRLRAGL